MYSFLGLALGSICGSSICLYLGITPAFGIIVGAPLGFIGIDLMIWYWCRKPYQNNIYAYLRNAAAYPDLTVALFEILGTLTHGSVYKGYERALKFYVAALNLDKESSLRAHNAFYAGVKRQEPTAQVLATLFTYGTHAVHIPILCVEMSLQLLLHKGYLSDGERDEILKLGRYFGFKEKTLMKLIAKRTRQISSSCSYLDKELSTAYKSTAKGFTTEKPHSQGIPEDIVLAFGALKLRTDATLAQVTAQYKKLRFKLHPDHHPQATDAQKERLAQDLIRLNTAYELLCTYLQA